MKYPKEYLDEIKLRLKVSQVVGKTVKLKKRGKEFIGLSPFKNEKSPSFTVNDQKEFYHCFSSSEHGNIFDFLMKTRSIGFGEAVKILAAEAGMQPYRFSNFDKAKDTRFRTYKNIYKDYLDNFHKELLNPKNMEPIDYLNSRNLNNNTIKEFRLGFVPWKNSFYENLLAKYSAEDISLTGLYYKNEKSGKFIDRFNSRIIFPINNINGDAIAFGGRIIKEGKLAKYINSPETEFYKKGNTIFNLDKAKDRRAETNEVIIVEGYMDVVSVYSSGIKNVISNSGTALTERQIDIIWKFFSDPIICLDGDQSGRNASLRIAEKLLPFINENNKIYFSIMPEGSDPDDFIKKNGIEKFISLLKDKSIIQSVIWNHFLNKIDKNNPFEISKFEKEIKKICYSIKDETLKKYVLEDFLEKIKDLTPIQSSQKTYFNFKNYNKKNYYVLNETKKLYKKKNHLSKIELKEFSIIFIIFNYPKIALQKAEELSNIEFLSQSNENLKNDIIKFLKKGEDINIFKTKILAEHKKLIDEIQETSSIKIILANKNDESVSELLDELLIEQREFKNQKRIESLEKDLVNNLDENSYSELIKLKSQINRE